MPNGAPLSFWPSILDPVGDVLTGTCDYPEHWVPADAAFTVEVDRGDGLKERRYQCATCGRVYVHDVVEV